MCILRSMNDGNGVEIETTSLWFHPSQQHGARPMGDPTYEGRTPSYLIANLIQRYTAPGDLVVDPFCGGGTTLDVADSLRRRSRGFDLAGHAGRPAGAGGLAARKLGPGTESAGGQRSMRIEHGDARALPVEANAAQLVFMDPPYSTHLEYSDDPRCIGKLSAFDDAYFDAMAEVFGEAERILAPGGYLAVYVSDTFEKRRAPGDTFVGIGAEFYCMLRRRLQPIDHIAVVRGNAKLEEPSFHEAAIEGNFYLRGYNHLLIFRKA
jgi:adenine-specific DNA-methyltransferase